MDTMNLIKQVPKELENLYNNEFKTHFQEFYKIELMPEILKLGAKEDEHKFIKERFDPIRKRTQETVRSCLMQKCLVDYSKDTKSKDDMMITKKIQEDENMRKYERGYCIYEILKEISKQTAEEEYKALDKLFGMEDGGPAKVQNFREQDENFGLTPIRSPSRLDPFLEIGRKKDNNEEEKEKEKGEKAEAKFSYSRRFLDYLTESERNINLILLTEKFNTDLTTDKFDFKLGEIVKKKTFNITPLKFEVNYSGAGSDKNIEIIEFQNWPQDHFTKENLLDINQLINYVIEQSNERKYAVQCSTGYGRSSVFAAFVNLTILINDIIEHKIDIFDENHRISIFRIVRELRTDRKASISLPYYNYLFRYARAILSQHYKLEQ